MGYTKAERARYEARLRMDTLNPKTLNPKLLVARANVRQHRAFRARVPWVPGYFTVPSTSKGFPGIRDILQFQYLKGSRVPWVPGNFTVPSTSRVPGFREILQFPVPPGFQGSLGSGEFYSSQYLQDSRVPWVPGSFKEFRAQST